MAFTGWPTWSRRYSHSATAARKETGSTSGRPASPTPTRPTPSTASPAAPRSGSSPSACFEPHRPRRASRARPASRCRHPPPARPRGAARHRSRPAERARPGTPGCARADAGSQHPPISGAGSRGSTSTRPIASERSVGRGKGGFPPVARRADVPVIRRRGAKIGAPLCYPTQRLTATYFVARYSSIPS